MILIIIKKSKLAVHFIYMNPNSTMYVLQTRHEHLGSFHSLMFCFKLTRKLLYLFSQVGVPIVGPLYAIV